MINLQEIPKNLPIPEDDGAADHLTGAILPAVKLKATNGSTINLGNLGGTVVIYAYPMTGVPNVALPDGWDEIPGARGCTPHSCAFRDHFQELNDLGVDLVFGVSTQTSDYQKEAADRLHLPFPLLSDSELRFQSALQLPTLEVVIPAQNNTLLKRLALIVREKKIEKCFYPVFPPEQNANDVLDWLKANKT